MIPMKTYCFGGEPLSITGKIYFSHEYEKSPPDHEVSQLLEVFDIQSQDMSEVFIKYDTEIKTFQDPASDNIEPRKYFKLPAGSLIVLLLKSHKGHLWTTIRRSTLEKRAYYLSKRGQVFECIRDD